MPPESDFSVVDVVTGMSNPDQMTVRPSGEIFAIEQWSGKVWHYMPGSAAKVIATVPTNAGSMIEEGMEGIACDPNFETNHWVYIYHTPATLGTMRLERFTYTGGTLSNPKIILQHPRSRFGGGKDERHAGGGMEWNTRTGDLFISVGDDTYPLDDISGYGGRDPANEYHCALRTAANTNDMRGKVLRIRPIPFPDTETPTPGVGTTYTIPPGNLFPVGTAKTLPEIYTMGTRNAYRVRTDTLTGWIYIGEVGADAPNNDYEADKGPPGFDHIYLAKGPANFGWPYVNGHMEPYVVRSYETELINAGMKVGQAFDPAHLRNISKFNTGLQDLPPATPPIVWYQFTASLNKGMMAALGGGNETVMIGPTYDYNPGLTSTVKLPPYFHRKVIFGDYSRHYLWLMTIDTAGTLTKLERIKTNVGMTDMHMGPDGSLYLLDYDGGKIRSLQYKGSQTDYKACSWVKEGCTDPKYAEYDPTANMMKPGSCISVSLKRQVARMPARVAAGIGMGVQRIVLPDGVTGAAAYDVHGVRVASARGKPGDAVELPARSVDGLLFIRYTRD